MSWRARLNPLRGRGGWHLCWSSVLQSLRELLKTTPWTLSLSAGFFGFYAHAGFVSVLEEENLRPRQITGCSAGALVGGLWASGCQIDTLKTFLFGLKRSDFWDPSFGFGLLAGERFDDILRGLLQCERFEKTNVPIQMAAFDLSLRRTAYLSRGDLASAIRASCAFPGLFHPVKIGGKHYLDGGILDRSGMGDLGINNLIVYHHLKSRSKMRLPSAVDKVGERNRLVELSIEGLTRLSPFQLERGPEAYLQARSFLQGRLEQPAQLN